MDNSDQIQSGISLIHGMIEIVRFTYRKVNAMFFSLCRKQNNKEGLINHPTSVINLLMASTREKAHSSGKRKSSDTLLCIKCGCQDFAENFVKAQQDGISKVVSSIKERAELYETDYISMN